MDWKLALLSLASIPISLIAMMTMYSVGMKKMGPYYMAGQKMNNTIIEYINGMEVVKVFNKDADSYERFRKDGFGLPGLYIGLVQGSVALDGNLQQPLALHCDPGPAAGGVVCPLRLVGSAGPDFGAVPLPEHRDAAPQIPGFPAHHAPAQLQNFCAGTGFGRAGASADA